MAEQVTFRRLAMALLAAAIVLAWFAGGIGDDPVLAAFAAVPAVSVFPMPGAHDAMPQSQITFRGIPIAAIGSLTVTGSASGAHTGHLESDSEGDGGSFLPDHPFTPGETVTVSTALDVMDANGGRGTPGGTWTFTVARPTTPLPSLHWPPDGRAPGDLQFFHSRHDLAPVSIIVDKHGANSDGDFFLGPQRGPIQDGPMILGPKGNLIWFDPLRGNLSVSDFRVQTYQGKPVLTWWQGTTTAGVGSGQDVIFDDTYREITTVSAGNGLRADLHAFQLTPQGTALITADYPIYDDATSVHGNKREIVIDSAVQEIDIPTGLVMFEWDAIDHIPLTDTHQPLPASLGSPYDPYHLNSIDLDRDGNVIVSARETWAAYKVSVRTGAVMWILGGRHSNFKFGSNASFAFQHDVRVRSEGDQYITLFDDEGGGVQPNLRDSRALELKLDFKRWKASAIVVDNHSPGLAASYEGNVQQLSNWNKVVGWGQQSYFSEYNTKGRQVFDAHLAGGNTTFATYRFPWTAIPWTVPAIAASTTGKSTFVYVSWNGATTVASWRVVGGSSPSVLRQIAASPKRGFETKLTVPASHYVAVEALDSAGHVIKTSATITPRV